MFHVTRDEMMVLNGQSSFPAAAALRLAPVGGRSPSALMFDGLRCRSRRALRLGEECERLSGHREQRRPVLPVESKRTPSQYQSLKAKRETCS